LRVGHAAVEDALIVFAQDLRSALDLRLRAFDFQIVVAEMSPDVQRRLEEFQVFVEGAKKFVDAAG
jgi:hypothetical protein